MGARDGRFFDCPQSAHSSLIGTVDPRCRRALLSCSFLCPHHGRFGSSMAFRPRPRPLPLSPHLSLAPFTTTGSPLDTPSHLATHRHSTNKPRRHVYSLAASARVPTLSLVPYFSSTLLPWYFQKDLVASLPAIRLRILAPPGWSSRKSIFHIKVSYHCFQLNLLGF